MRVYLLLKSFSFHLAIYACASISIFCLLLIGGLGVTWGSSSIANTTLRLEIISSFTGSVTYTGNTTLFINGIHRTTGVNHTIILSSSTNVTYSSSGDIIESTTGAIYFPSQYLVPIQLTPGEGQKEVFITYTPLTGVSEDQLPLAPVIYGVDLTPPPLTTSYSGPEPINENTDTISFSWDPVIDTGVGLHHYIIQLSHTANFTTVMEFTSTELEIILGAGSVTPGQRYRRRGAEDGLGNQFYAPGIAFTITNTNINTTTIGSISSVSNLPTPLSDQCPKGDTSGNYFDGICSLLTKPPMLLNVPSEHQASDGLPRREKMYNELTEPKTTLYVFPNYEAPKALTIYEHTPNYVYNDIYEYTDTSNKYPSLPYQPSLGVKKTTPPNAPTKEFISKFTGISTTRATTYLFYWFVQTENSCSDIGQFCPQDPVCGEAGSSCYYERMLCPEKHISIERCIRIP